VRKHRRFGVVIAALLGVGVVLHLPSTPDDHHVVATDLGRVGLRLAAATLLAEQLTSPVDANQAFQSAIHPYRSHFLYELATWATYIKAHTPPPPGQLPPGQLPPGQLPPPPQPSGDVWAALRQCESGGNYSDNTGNGYYGAYQFSLSTWQGLGLSGLPSDASPAAQDQAAHALQVRSGWGQWPACARELRLI
jgi:hypothetical protein